MTTDDAVHVAFLAGTSRLIFKEATFRGTLSTPRGVLCAADVIAQAVLQMQSDLKDEITLLPTQFFTDIVDIIAWINNRSASFTRYE